jgi:hypothetical protein
MGVNMSLIFLISFVVFGAHLLALSFSKSTYQKLQKDNGEKFANQVTKGRICGCLLILVSAIGFLL